MKENQKQAEERGFRKLLENPDGLQRVLDTIVCGVITVDAQGRITYTNNSARRMLGLSRKELIEHHYALPQLRLLGEDGRAVPAEKLPFSRVLKGGESIRGEVLTLENARKETLHMVVNVIPLRSDDGAISGAVADFIDVTDAREAELALRRAKDDAEAASQAKSRFLANMSHEVRTPMTVFMGMVELTLAGKLEADQRKYLETALASADSLLMLIEEVLQFSELESDTLVLTLERFDLPKCIRKTLAPFQEEARGKGLDLRLSLSADLPAKVTGDERRLECILRNLIGNAVKFTPNGWIRVEVSPCPDCAPARTSVRFTVRDSGIGIDSEKIDLLFRPFTQVDDSSTRPFDGAGLGLAICKGLVEKMGGEIRVLSDPGGSTFSFYLPFEAA